MKKETGDERKSTGLLVVTHGDYGRALLEAATMILGPQERAASIGVDATTEVERTVAAIREAITSVDAGGGVLILTDMFGGTPTNLSLSLLGSANIEVITGVNLPMLLKCLGSRRTPPADLAQEAKRSGVQGIVVAGEILRKKLADG